jgi:hypothetical protein
VNGLSLFAFCRCGTCKSTVPIRRGSFFSRSSLSLQKWLILLYWWVRQYPVTDAAQEAEVGRDTAIDVYQWFRDICSARLVNTVITLGGANHIVQVDESLFRHKPKVCQHKISVIINHTYSIIEVVHQSIKCGCSEWWMCLLIHQ